MPHCGDPIRRNSRDGGATQAGQPNEDGLRQRHDYDDWIAAAGEGLDGLRTLLGWALGARGDVEIIRNASSWTMRDHGAKPKDNARLTWTDGTSPPLRFDAERIDPTVARCPDEATFLHAAAREVARRPNL